MCLHTEVPCFGTQVWFIENSTFNNHNLRRSIMAHATSQGLSQETGALSALAISRITDLQKRGVTAEFVSKYRSLTTTMEDTIVSSSGKNSDKKQMTGTELTAKDELLADVRRFHGAVKRVFPKGSPVRDEFFVGKNFNHSTALLLKWEQACEKGWEKYKDRLIAEGNLIQEDVDTMKTNAAKLQGIDSTHELAKHVDAPEATAAALKAMKDVEDAADFIYGAAEAEYAKQPVILGEFEKLKPLRYAVKRNPPQNPPPTNPTQK